MRKKPFAIFHNHLQNIMVKWLLIRFSVTIKISLKLVQNFASLSIFWVRIAFTSFVYFRSISPRPIINIQKGNLLTNVVFFSTKHFFLNFNPFPSQCSLFILLKTSENFWGGQNKTLGVNGLKICIDYNPKWIKTLINIYIYKVFRWKNKNYISKKYFDVFSSTVLCFIYINIYIYIYIYI